MTTYYVRTDGNNANAGTTDSSGGAWATIEYAASHVAAGDTVMVRASAGNALSYPTSSLDYTISSFFTPTAGSAANGYVRWIGYNGIPTIDSPGLGFYNCSFNWFEGLYLVASSNANGSFGMIYGDSLVIKKCILNLNNKATLMGIQMSSSSGAAGLITASEIYGGTTSPTLSGGSYGIQTNDYGIIVEYSRIHHTRDHGIYDVNCRSRVRGNLIYGTAANGVHFGNTMSITPAEVVNNTIDGNAADGIGVGTTNGAAGVTIKNNIISNHTTSAKYGINVATSSSDKRKMDWGYNCFYNNTSHRNNVTADTGDQDDVDPQYTDRANGDFSIGTNLRALGFPGAFYPAAPPTGYTDIGAVQRQEPSSGSSIARALQQTNIGTY